MLKKNIEKKIYCVNIRFLLFTHFDILRMRVDILCAETSQILIGEVCKDIKFVKIDYVINGMQKVRVKVARQTSRGFSN